MVQLKSSDSVPKTRDQMVSFCSYQAITVLGLMFFTPLSIFFMDQERSIPNTRASSTTNKIQTTKSEQWTEVPRPPTPSEAAMIASLVKENDICQGKEPLLEILLRAGQDKVTEAECELLPTWEEVVSVYGEEPVVYGLESCKQYREHVARTSDLEPQVRVAGLFNTGTNALSQSFHINIAPVDDPKYDYNNPGGKHVPPKQEWLSTFEVMAQRSNYLQVVLVRDPFRWMLSMCKAGYNAKWIKGLDGRCPNLVPSVKERQMPEFKDLDTFEVTVSLKGHSYYDHYDSLIDLWSEWNNLYYHADYPRLMIRFEDTLFHAERVMHLITECAGIETDEPFKYHIDSSKHLKSSADFVTALGKYGSAYGRYDGLTPPDMKYLQTHLDEELMKVFHYKQPAESKRGHESSS